MKIVNPKSLKKSLEIIKNDINLIINNELIKNNPSRYFINEVFDAFLTIDLLLLDDEINNVVETFEDDHKKMMIEKHKMMLKRCYERKKLKIIKERIK